MEPTDIRFSLAILIQKYEMIKILLFFDIGKSCIVIDRNFSIFLISYFWLDIEPILKRKSIGPFNLESEIHTCGTERMCSYQLSVSLVIPFSQQGCAILSLEWLRTIKIVLFKKYCINHIIIFLIMLFAINIAMIG